MRWFSVVLALCIGAAAAGMQLAQLTAPIDDAIYDRIAPNLTSGGDALPEVVVVAIDDPSFAEVGQVWPWPRSLHARLIETLRAAGARRIGYDVVFADPAEPRDDRALGMALGPDVVLARYAVELETPQGVLQMTVAPHSQLTKSGAQVGSIDLPVDRDGAIRRLAEGADSFAALLAHPANQPPPGARIRFVEAGLTLVSFYQALNAGSDLPAGLFRDKVVLVGMSLESTPSTAADTFRTPETALGRGFMPGVQIHAHAFRTLACGAWIVPVPIWVPSVLAFLMATGTAIAASRSTGATAAAVTAGSASLPLVASALGLSFGMWFAPSSAVAAALLGGAGQMAADYARERRIRREITRIFGHYLAPELVQRLIDNPGALRLGGERRVVTVLFCDLRGFTTLSERMRDDPETLTRIVNAALGTIAETVMANRGMVDKFIGDCVMALWNAPADDDEHAANAVRAGREMVHAIAALSDRLRGEGVDVRLACGVGINTGECTVGNMGSERRLEYTAIGDPVNLASRLETLTKAFGTPILVGQATAMMVSQPELAQLGQTTVKGRVEPETVFGVAEFLSSIRDLDSKSTCEAVLGV